MFKKSKKSFEFAREQLLRMTNTFKGKSNTFKQELFEK